MESNPKDLSYKWGIALKDLCGDQKLHYVSEALAYKSVDSFSLIEKFLPYQTEIEEHWGWPKNPTQEALMAVSNNFYPEFFGKFSFDELSKYMFDSATANDIVQAFQRKDIEDRVLVGGRYRNLSFEIVPPEPAEFVYKLKSSLWNYGSYPSNWNHLVTAYYAIPDYSFGPGFEVRFDHTMYFNYWGRAQHLWDQVVGNLKTIPAWGQTDDSERDYQNEYITDNTVYLDGIFGYLIYYQGKHVMTLGFSVGDDQIFLSQVQLRTSKGNRWLYKLPKNYLSHVIDTFYQHFVTKWGMKLYLVEGESIAKRIAKVHNKEAPLASEIAARITEFYNQLLENYHRSDKTLTRNELTFHQLKHTG